ncbi:MAG: PIN domain-containing protein [Candidatus Pacearchaeota archaeon]|nr:PIN domain-containing protein [Candidatus Pacearchaeota archaeon]
MIKQKEKAIQQNKKYVVDTSVIAQKKLFRLFKDKLKGNLLIPNAVIAELENLANKGQEVGFFGLEEIAKLHKIKNRVKITFIGDRPTGHQIKYAKSGEIDALIRDLAFKEKATLITADKVQWKSAEAYGIPVFFIKTKVIEEKKKKRFIFFKRKKGNRQ